MVEITYKAILGAVLLCCGVQDIFGKKIMLWVLVLGAFLMGICIPFCNSPSILDRIGGIGIGVAVIMISIATAGKIGLGDGLILCLTGLGLGFWANLELFAIALMIAAIVSIILLIARLADRKKSIPFVPFLLIGYIILMLVG